MSRVQDIAKTAAGSLRALEPLEIAKTVTLILDIIIFLAVVWVQLFVFR